jgi:urease accessory protein
LIEIDRLAAATRLAREPREASARTGARVLATAVLLAPGDGTLHAFARAVSAGLTPGAYAAAFGAAAAALSVPAEAAVLAELHGAASGLLGAALRLMRIDHQQTQAILRRQAPRLATLASAALKEDWQALRPCAPLAEILQMRHEGAHVRLFSS